MIPTSKRGAMLAVAVLGLVVEGMERARADLVVVPNSNATVEGDSNNAFPFNLALAGVGSQRYEQVYASSQFPSLGGALVITQILFRPDATFGSAFSSTLPDIRIDLSTTSATPASLSTTFANNVGADDTVVFQGPLSLSSSFTGPPGGPKDFDITINLTTPFLYDPAKGDLLMDVRNFQGGATTQFDATSSGSVTQRVWSRDVNSSTGTLDTLAAGLVTEFAFTAVPELDPGSMAGALALASGGLAVLTGRRRKRAAA